MAKNVFIVSAYVVDANGTFNFLSGYPKTFKTASYDEDEEITKKRAEGELSDCWGKMCKRDDRLVQTVAMHDVYGNELDRKSMGGMPV